MKTKNRVLLLFLLFQSIFQYLSVMAQQPQWTVYTTANSEIAGNWVLSLAEEQNGTKWIGTLSGLSKLHDSTWTNYFTTNSGLLRNHIHEITIDHQNNKWFSVPFSKTPYEMGGIHKFDGNTWTVYTINNAPMINEKYQGIEFDTQGNLWIGMGRYLSGPSGSMIEGGATVKLASGGWNIYQTSNSGIAWNDVYCFASDTGSTIWIGNYGGIANSGLLKFYNNTWTVYGTDNSGLPEQNVMDIEINGHNVWVATTFGIGKFDRLSNQWTVYRENNSPLPSSITICVVVDQIGAVWMGTLYGLARLYNGNWNVYTTSNSPLPHNIIEKIMVAADGKKWIATRGGLVVYDDSYLVGVITAIPEGFYNSVTNKLNREDTLRAYLRNAATPYNIVDSAKTVIDSVSFTGRFTFITAPSGNYYIVLKHRNSLETWSKSGGETISQGETYLYNFTDSSSQAYGNNMIQKGTKFCIYSGDVNQDGTIDGTDGGIVDNDAFNFLTGYVPSDVNGDGIIDSSDNSIVDNNAFNFIGKITP